MEARGRGVIVGKSAVIICFCLLLPILALGQGMNARFFTPKSTYLVGEPIFITLEFTNDSPRTVWIEPKFGRPCLGENKITIEGAKRTRHGWKTALDCGGGIGGSCGSAESGIRPGQAFSGRIFLNYYYQLDQPSAYEVRIQREIPVFNQENPGIPTTTVEASADFDIQLAQGSEEELKAAFEPVLRELESGDAEKKWQAIQAVTEMAQPFLQQTIIDLSKNRTEVGAAIEGLYKLNTSKARDRLAELTQYGETDTTREGAMQALAALGDRHYLPLFFRLAKSLNGYARNIAIESTGLLGGSRAVPFLSSLIDNQDPTVRMAAIRGLAGTAKRGALVPLILEIRDPDPNVRQVANAALAQLTHLSASRHAWALVPNPAATFQKWHDWWLANGFRAPIYGPTDCTQPKLLN